MMMAGEEQAHSVSKPAGTASPFEIAGYQLQSRLGAGGFGEVWRAIGPGGFAKAVKILFGNHSGPQAEMELKSLHRIRDLRHPFLLNIERIEIVDGRVVIVTELADRSLERRFAEASSQGLRGVPRDELLGYLRDVADALDFMSEQHGLQHLDIKPENLFLQGSHAKVGDFGMTKNLLQEGQSIVNGFTPLYAAPELFDGRPDRATDQYSLAIVYQMMLSGGAPFSGRTAAQLAAQHLKSSPDLNGLHPSDRAVVARALAKNPRARFAGCRQFIDELAKRRFGVPAARRASDSSDADRPPSLTAIVDTATVGRHESQVLPSATPLRPVSTAGTPLVMRPTVFVGIGGLGGRVIELLHAKSTAMFPHRSLPALQFLCIDSDPESCGSGDFATQAGVSPLQTMAIPLRTSHDYRKVSGDHLNWLSRRWLFNIPRSGRVEGLRPLGRLAFVDHEEEVRERLRACLKSAWLPASVNSTGEQTGLPFTDQEVDVVLIGSTCGGTSSGSLLDIAWMVRSLLGEKPHAKSRIAAMLLHGTSQGRQSAEMQDANTISFLQELQYFCLPGVQRPGTSTRSGSAAPALPFDDAWLVHLGDEISTPDFHAALEKVADYLELRTLSPARQNIDAWRILGSGSRQQDADLMLHTFGLVRVSEDAWGSANAHAAALCLEITRHWLQAHSAGRPLDHLAQVAAQVTELINDLALTGDGVIERVPKLLNAERTKRLDIYASEVRARLIQNTCGQSDVIQHLTELINSDLTAGSSSSSAIASITDEVRRDLASGLSGAVSRIEKHVQECLENAGRLQAAEQSVASLLRAVDNALLTGEGQKQDLEQAFADLCSSYSSCAATESDPALRGFCRQYCMLLACQLVCQCVTVQIKSLRDSVLRLKQEKLKALRVRVQNLRELLKSENAACVPCTDSQRTAFDEYLLTQGRFRLSMLQIHDVKPTDASTLVMDAANFLLMTDGEAAFRPAKTGEHGSSTTFPGTARPLLRNLGGGQRVMAVTPERVSPETWLAQLQNEFGQCVSVVSMNRPDISVFCETEGIAISSVIDSLSHLKPKVVELAGRLHARQDIPW